MPTSRKPSPAGNWCESGLRGGCVRCSSLTLWESALGWQRELRGGLRRDPSLPGSKPGRDGGELPAGRDVKNQRASNAWVSTGSAEGFGEGEYKKSSNDAPDDLSNSTGKAGSQQRAIRNGCCSSQPLPPATCYAHSPPSCGCLPLGCRLGEGDRTGRPSPWGYCTAGIQLREGRWCLSCWGGHGCGTTSSWAPRAPARLRAHGRCLQTWASPERSCGAMRWHRLEGTDTSGLNHHSKG